MSRSFPSLHLVGDSTSPRAQAARAAAQDVQPGAVMRQSSNLAAATATRSEGPEVLVLIDATPEDFKIACAALDQRGLPRWAVVPPLAEDFAPAAAFAPAWEPPALA